MKRALLVGINYYGTGSQLSGCINDVHSVASMLTTVYDYQVENILIITDDTIQKPTQQTILKAWEWLLSSAPASVFSMTFSSYNYPLASESQLVFHYSGHGTQVYDRSGDEGDRQDEAICPLDYETNGMIVDDVIRSKLIDRVPKNCKLFSVMDCCNSGSNFDLLYNIIPTAVSKPSFPTSMLPASLFPDGYSVKKSGKYKETAANVCMISGCKDFQTSADTSVDGVACGALSYALVTVLRDNKYKLTYEELIKKVNAYIVENRLSNQIPCMSFGQSPTVSDKFEL